METRDVVIIGAGPSGAVAAALLRQKGWQVLVLEKGHFPRFVIGESLLPACMEVLSAANMTAAIRQAAEPLAFQLKNGAAFTWGERYTAFDFTRKFTAGPGITYQVRRAAFDQLLIDEAAKQGAEVRYGHGVTAFRDTGDGAEVDVQPEDGAAYTVRARFVLDGSGYGRVLPRLLDLERPSVLPERMACFTHIKDNITDPDYDRQKILISTPTRLRDVWLWLIPFADGVASLGVVGEPARLEALGDNPEAMLRAAVADVPLLARFLQNADWNTGMPVRSLRNYSANVSTLYGDHFALLGNASEFLDPVFSSGVTVAVVSSQLAAAALDRQLRGEAVDWQRDYAKRLAVGVEAFKTYVLGWYDGSFQDVIYASEDNPEIRAMICAILAGYAWDTDNPYVEKPQRRLAALAEVVREQR